VDWNEGSVALAMDLVTICSPELTLDDANAIAAQSQKAWEQVGRELGIM